MNLDGALTEAEFGGGDFIGFAAANQRQYFPLARRERVTPRADASALAELDAVLAVRFQRPLHPVDEVLIAERLLQEVERTLLHGLHGHRDVAVPGDEDHRNDRAAQIQLLLQLETAHTGHAHVEYQAARPPWIIARKKLMRGAHTGAGEANRLHQQLQRVAHGLIVVNYEDAR